MVFCQYFQVSYVHHIKFKSNWLWINDTKLPQNQYCLIESLQGTSFLTKQLGGSRMRNRSNDHHTMSRRYTWEWRLSFYVFFYSVKEKPDKNNKRGMNVHIAMSGIVFHTAYRKFIFKNVQEGRKCFNNSLDTFYLRLYGVGHLVTDSSESERGKPVAH